VINTEELQAFGDKHYPETADKTISVNLVRAWLFAHHYHDSDGLPRVDSLELEKFVTQE